MNTGQTPNNYNKAISVQPAKLTQFATQHRIRLREWVASKMEDGPQNPFPKTRFEYWRSINSTYKHTWRILHYVIILGTLVRLLTLVCSVSVVNYIDIIRTYSITAFARGYSVGIGRPKLCNKLIYYYYHYYYYYCWCCFFFQFYPLSLLRSSSACSQNGTVSLPKHFLFTVLPRTSNCTARIQNYCFLHWNIQSMVDTKQLQSVVQFMWDNTVCG